MKKFLLVFAALAALLLAYIAGQTCMSAHIYPETAVLTSINSAAEEITVTCANGNRFAVRTASEDWCIGDLCSLLVYDNNTETVEDDKILQIRYSGTPSMFQQYIHQ